MSGQETQPDRIDAAPAVAALSQLLALHRRGIELDLRVAAPARVVSYDPATQRASVTLELLPVQFVSGVEVPQPPIAIPQVPVRWPGGSVGYVTTPLVPGDTGAVVFCDRCMSLWNLQGGPLDPKNGRTHNLADCYFEPGLRNATNPIAPPTSLAATVVEGPLVWLGATATNGVVLDLGGLAATLAASIIALQAIAAAPIPEPPAPGAGAAIDGILAALIPVLQAITVSTKVFAEPVP